MHWRATCSGAPILRGVTERISCRVCHCTRCGTDANATALPRQPPGSPRQARLLKQKPEMATPPQCERVAIALLLSCFFRFEARCVFQLRRKLCCFALAHGHV